MYVTAEELAKYLNLTPEYIVDQIKKGNVKAVYDGETYLLNKDQFTWHKEQIKKRLEELRREEEEGIPEDIDVKDED